MQVRVLLAVTAVVWACGGGGPPGGGGGGTSDGGSGGTGGGGSGGGGADGGGSGGTGGGGGTLAAGGGDWAQYRGGIHGTSENPGVFDAAEAANLKVAWTKDLSFNGTAQLYTQAMIIGDTAFFTTAISANVVALNASNGDVLWSRAFDRDVTTACMGVEHRGFWAAPAVVGDIAYLAAPDGHAYALRARDGSTIWASAIADPTAAGHGEFLQSSPAVSTALGKLYLGIASSEHCDEVRGKIAMVDLATGAAVVKPLVPEGRQGGGIWSSISIDEDARLVFAGTANRLGDIAGEPLAQSLVSFRADTLDVVDHWQNPTTLENSDFGSSPTLFQTANGTPLVAAANKDGVLYVLRRDRLSAGPVWTARLAVIDPNRPNEGGDPIKGFGSLVSPTFAHGLLYAAGGRTPAGEPGAVVAFDPSKASFDTSTGPVVWKHVTPGYVLAAMPAVGDILIVESSAPDNQASWLEVLDARTGSSLRRFTRDTAYPDGAGAVATMAAPSVGRGLILWTDANAHVTALVAPKYRP